MITSPADTLVCDTTQLAVWQSDPAYDYGRELMAPDINVFEWFNRWFGKILQKIFGSHFAEEYSELILIGIAILLLILIIWFVYKKRPELFMISRKNALPYAVEEDTIMELTLREVLLTHFRVVITGKRYDCCICRP